MLDCLSATKRARPVPLCPVCFPPRGRVGMESAASHLDAYAKQRRGLQ